MRMEEQLRISNNPFDLARRMVAPICKENLDTLIHTCSECSTFKSNFKKVATSGNPNANILIINDVAITDAEVNGYFFSLLEEVQLDLGDVFIANAISCEVKRPDGSNRVPTKEEICNCKHFIQHAIKFVDPNVIIIMGPTSYEMFKEKGTFADVLNDETYIYDIKTYVTHSVRNIVKAIKTKSDEEVNEMENQFCNAVFNAIDYIEKLKNGGK